MHLGTNVSVVLSLGARRLYYAMPPVSRPACGRGPLRVNNGEALMPALIADVASPTSGLCRQPFTCSAVEVILKGWHQTEGSVHLVMPPGGPRPARVEVLADFLAKKLAKGRTRTS